MSHDPGLRFAGLVIPESELDWSYDTPGGPGGQHANRAATRVTLAFDVSASLSLPEDARRRLLDLGPVVRVTVDDTRSQWRNRALARRRLTEVLEEALRPRRARRPTNPTHASRRRRLEHKRQRGMLKRLRRRPGHDD